MAQGINWFIIFRVYGGGAVIDTNGKNITIGQALLAPTGNGVSATGLVITGGSGYIAPPFVISAAPRFAKTQLLCIITPQKLVDSLTQFSGEIASG